MKRILILLLALCLLLCACGRTTPNPETTPNVELTTTAAPITQETETQPNPPDETPAGGRYVFYRFEYAPGEFDGNYYIWLPDSMSIQASSSIIMDMEFAGFDDPNSPPEPPRKVGEFCGVYELALGETLEELAGANYQNSEESTWTHLDAGEFAGRRGNRIYYQVVAGSFAYYYHFCIQLDDTRVAQLYFWNSVYTPDVDLPRFSEIAGSVRL